MQRPGHVRFGGLVATLLVCNSPPDPGSTAASAISPIVIPRPVHLRNPFGSWLGGRGRPISRTPPCRLRLPDLTLEPEIHVREAQPRDAGDCRARTGIRWRRSHRWRGCHRSLKAPRTARTRCAAGAAPPPPTSDAAVRRSTIRFTIASCIGVGSNKRGQQSRDGFPSASWHSSHCRSVRLAREPSLPRDVTSRCHWVGESPSACRRRD